MNDQSVASEASTSLETAGELRVVLGQLTRRLRQQASSGDFTRSQTSVLARLDRDGPATKSELARAEGIQPQSMGAIISVLEEAGIVNGVPDPADGRKIVFSLTESAIELLATGRLAREDWLWRAIQTQLAPDEQVELARSVSLLRKLTHAS
jgi:DNA-binding MarR family transcriptional regulator